MKATQKGTCQCCGSLQKLPNGVLSTHGYKVLNGWFEGVCPGTGHLPLELSCDLVQHFADNARVQLGYRETEKAELETNPGTTVWVNHYVKRGSYRNFGSVNAGYHWRKGTYAEHEVTSRDESYTYTVGTATFTHLFSGETVVTDLQRVYAGSGTDGHTTQSYQNLQYIRGRLDPQIKATRSYIAHQEKVVATWTEQPLKPLK